MTRVLEVVQIGPAAAVQDLGRPGFIAAGLTQGGAIDRTAVYEGAALLGQDPHLAVLEIASIGGSFMANTPTRIALTGADMMAEIDGAKIAWNASHLLEPGQTLTLKACRNGSFGYVHVGGGFNLPVQMGGRGAHASAGLGEVLAAGMSLPIGDDAGTRTGDVLPRDARFAGGTVRVVRSFQSAYFSEAEQERFAETQFSRDPRANRQGVRLMQDGAGFAATGAEHIVSDVIVTGDIQITGDGTPFVLMCESQTTGGYPRIGTVLPCDLPRVAQAPAGAPLQFEFVDMDTARRLEATAQLEQARLSSRLTPLLRAPADIADLLSYQLISGAVSADADPFN